MIIQYYQSNIYNILDRSVNIGKSNFIKTTNKYVKVKITFDIETTYYTI